MLNKAFVNHSLLYISAGQAPDPILVGSGSLSGGLKPAQVVVHPHGPGLAVGIVSALPCTVSPTIRYEGSSACSVATPVDVSFFSYHTAWRSVACM